MKKKTKTKKFDVARKHWIPRNPPESARVFACFDPRINGGHVLGVSGLFVLVDLGIGSWVLFEGRSGTFEGRVEEIIREPGRNARVVLKLSDGSTRRVLKSKCSIALEGAN